MTRLGLVVALLLALGAGCADAKICKEAATRYGACVGEVLGPEMAKLARSKEKQGIAACSKDKKTQAMYEKCLPSADCKGFMKCIQDYALAHGP